MKRSVFIMAGVAILALAVALGGLVSCNKPKVVEKPISTAAQTPSGAASTPAQPAPAPGPHPEAAIGIPEVSRKSENILVVYRHTGPGYAESYGFDTYIFRVLTDGSGQITGGTSYQRTLGGEIQAVSFNSTATQDAISLTASPANGKSWLDKLAIRGEKIEVTGAHTMIVGLDTALSFASADKKYQESYSVDQARKDLPSEIVQSGAVVEKGLWTYPETGKADYSQAKPDDTQNAEGFKISLWYADKGDLRFTTEGPEPINEVYAAGLAQVLAGDHALVNAALLDLMLGESRYLRPLYAFAISRRGQGK